MQIDLTRRGFLTGLAATPVVASVPGVALALNERSAKVLVTKLVDDINATIASGKSDAALFRDFEKIFARYADVATIARYALGVQARSTSAAQLREFTQVYQRYIAVKYGKRFREFIGGRIEVQSARAVKSFYEVKSVAYLQGQSPFEVVFLVSDRSGKDLFFNLFIEGINMLLTERTEIGQMLDRRRGDLNAVIADLKKAS